MNIFEHSDLPMHIYIGIVCVNLLFCVERVESGLEKSTNET
jgi:hypothetical protein